MFKTCSVHPVHLTFLTSQIVYRNLEVEHLNLGFTSCLAKKVNKTFVKDGVDHEFLQPNIGILKKNNFQLFVREFEFLNIFLTSKILLYSVVINNFQLMSWKRAGLLSTE